MSSAGKRLPVFLLLVALAMLPGATSAPETPLRGVVVESVEQGWGAERGGLRPGDVLLEWRREAVPPANPRPARGTIATPFDLLEVEMEESPRGPVRLTVSRGDRELALTVVPGRYREWPGEWGLVTRPRLDGDDERAYQGGLASIESSRIEQGIAAWRALAGAWMQAGRFGDAAWLHFRAALQHKWLDDPRAARDALVAALDAARPGADQTTLLQIMFRLGIAQLDSDDLEAAASIGGELLALRERQNPRGLAAAAVKHDLLAMVASIRNDVAELDRLELAIHDTVTREAPESLRHAVSLHNMGMSAMRKGHVAAAEDYFLREIELEQRIVKDSVPAALFSLGWVAYTRGDLDRAERAFERVLDSDRRSGVPERWTAITLNWLGRTALRAGDTAKAGRYFTEALEIRRRVAPGTMDLASSLETTAGLRRVTGRLEEARRLLDEALAIRAEIAPGGLGSTGVLVEMGNVAIDGGDLTEASLRFGSALEIVRRFAPGTLDEATCHHGLGRALRRQGHPTEALASFLRAIDVFESQARNLGGSQEEQTRFRSRYLHFYEDTLDLLMELGRPQEAFGVLERARARVLLGMIVQRGVRLDAGLPEELRREREAADAEYDGLMAELAGAASNPVEAGNEASHEDQEKSIRERLEAARERQRQVRERIRAAAPHVAELSDPRTLDLAAAREALDAGTLLLSYAVGRARSYLFAVGPGTAEFRGVDLGITQEDLAGRVEALLEAVRAHRGSRRRSAYQEAAADLSRRLLTPVAGELRRAERLLIIPDGPLHSLPFSMLPDPSGGEAGRPLIASRPIHVAPSATVMSEMKRRRRPRGAGKLAAFGDPVPPSGGGGGEGAAPEIGAALRGGFRLGPLPASRLEVEALAAIYPGSATLYIGPEATEDRAKSLGADLRVLHFACHGILDERYPLDSALALTIPPSWKPGAENGLLQAWEIFEQVRLDADLVTLSACETGRGRTMAGEGVLGLSRAFHFAGARSVVASLWAVPDESTAELMRRFYGHLKEGSATAEALRRAQVELLNAPLTLERGGRRVEIDASAPWYWAAFQVMGDWR